MLDVAQTDSFPVGTVLQETDTQRVEAIGGDDGERIVRKTYRRATRSFRIESEFLRVAGERRFQFLSLPTLLDAGDRWLTMTFVQREHQTRDSILRRDWTDANVVAFFGAVRELQQIPLPQSCFSVKQKVMGVNYPVSKLCLLHRRCLNAGILGMNDSGWLARMLLQYTSARLMTRNCTVHYDLTTLNCAFTPSGKLSILDFEFPYFGGDPLFDVCYFVTIPPVSITHWTFQAELIGQFIQHDLRFAKCRVRLILTVCCLVRALFFDASSQERQQYLRSLETLRDIGTFTHFFDQLT